MMRMPSYQDPGDDRRSSRGAAPPGSLVVVRLLVLMMTILTVASAFQAAAPSSRLKQLDRWLRQPRTNRPLLPNSHDEPKRFCSPRRTSSSALYASLPSSSSGSNKSRNVAKQAHTASLTEQEQTLTTTNKANDEWIAANLNKDEAAVTSHPPVVGPEHVLIYDTTLRDGTQGESVSASVDDKLKICQRLAAFDVDYIEGGWPGSNPKDQAFFERATVELDEAARSKLVAFGSTRRKNCRAEDDKQLQALLDSGAPTVCLVAKSHPWQVTDILRASLEENLNMISDSVRYLCSQGKQVMVDLEHFLDGYASDADYALQCCEAAVEAGASCLVLCDTNGGSMPWQVTKVCEDVVSRFGGSNGVTIGIHCHNDCGMAVANSVCAAQAGVGLIQGTINGIGERTGNADLCSIVPSLALHVDSKMTCHDQLSDLTKTSRYVDEILNRTPNQAAPFVGSSAFAHKGGLHVAAMERSPLSYQHIQPELVGNEKRVLISELSGRQNILGKMEQVGVLLKEGDDQDSAASERAVRILNRVKQLEAAGYTFEGAEASVHLMILHSTRGYCPPFQVLDYSAHVYDSDLDSASRVMRDKNASPVASSQTARVRATVQVRTVLADEEISGDVDSLPYQDRLEVSDGTGPVDALAQALVRALKPSHPSLSTVELVDYKVRILDPESATTAATRVMIEFRDTAKETTWTTVSVDRNVISASLNALIDGYEFALIEHASSCLLCDDAF